MAEVVNHSLTRLLNRFPITVRSARNELYGSVGETPTPLRATFHAFGGATLGDGFYRFHTPTSSAEATMICRPLMPSDGEFASFAFDWSGREVCVNLATNDVIVVDPAMGDWYNTETDLNGWHDELAAEPGLLAFALYVQWRRKHPAIGPLGFDEVIGFERPIFLGGVEDVDHLELWTRRVYLGLFVQLRLRTEHLPIGAVVDDDILDQVRRDLGLGD